MSGQDVDDEFERAYNRLFSASSAAEASTGTRKPSSSKSAAPSVQATQPVASGSRTALSGSFMPRFDRKVREAVSKNRGLHALSRKLLESKALLASHDRPPAQQHSVHRKRRAQPRPSHSDLEDLSRHGAASDAKGKARAHPRPERVHWHAESSSQSPSMPSAVATPHSSSSIPHAGGVAYYPYAHGQVPYPMSGPLVPAALTPVPGPALAWAQPVMVTGLVPSVAYPGFSASVTFSQPQFFTSHPQPQPLQPAITALPADAWPHQYTLSPSGSALPASHHPNAQRERHELRPAHHGQLRAPRSVQPIPSGTKTQRKASQFRAGAVEAKRKKSRPEPTFEDNDEHISRKQGPSVRRGLPVPDHAEPSEQAISEAARVKVEALEEEGSAFATSATAQDLYLPLSEDAGLPYKIETHTLFVHPSRRLRWLTRLALARVDPQANAESAATLSAASSRQWARWSFLSAAGLQRLLEQNAASASDATSSPAAPAPSTASQSDPAGLFPRERRRAYVALRKDIHTAVHTATSRICVPRLVRYLAKTAGAARRIESTKERRSYVERKHRAAKLSKHVLRFKRPTVLDARSMWSVWARAAHARTSHIGGTSAQAATPMRRVAFAAELATPPPATPPPPATARADVPGATRVKLEPESPAAQRALMLSCAEVKPEPDTDVVADATVRVKTEHEVESALPMPESRVAESPLFLRRNFRVYRLLGLSQLPLS